jgi:Fe2+ transport system protein FeoA
MSIMLLTPHTALQAGDFGEIHSVVGAPELVRHLAELGLRQGSHLEMIQQGATCILRINGTKLCVRGDELLRVMVTPLPTTGHSAPATGHTAPAARHSA